MEGDTGCGLHHIRLHLDLPPGGQVVHVHHQLEVVMNWDNFTGKPVLVGDEQIRAGNDIDGEKEGKLPETMRKVEGNEKN